MSLRGWLVLALLAVMAVFAVEGGEYSTWDYRALQREVADEQARQVRLTEMVDSLTRLRKAIETDPAVQERIAREQYGMIRPGERLYRLAPAPAAGRGANADVP
ncbi:MAG TPA: septum formation initiator family protein [Gemmatimonadales bacterium]|jgi:cell division protein FtsB|nr:septum formation initiator family protein [Gemmatimonadales bacterium]